MRFATTVFCSLLGLGLCAAVGPIAAARADGFDFQTTTQDGLTLTVTDIAYKPDWVILGAQIVNGTGQDQLFNRNKGFVLQDGAGTVYSLSVSPLNPEVKVPAGAKLEGPFVFARRPAPAGLELRLATNDYGSGPGAPRLILSLPRQRGDGPLPNTRPVELDAGARVEAAGLEITVTALSLRSDVTVASIDIQNRGAAELALNGPAALSLRDDLGHSYRLNPPPANPRLLVPAQGRMTGEWVFMGRLDPAAKALTLTGQAGDAPFTLALPAAAAPAPAIIAEAGRAQNSWPLPRSAVSRFDAKGIRIKDPDDFSEPKP